MRMVRFLSRSYRRPLPFCAGLIAICLCSCGPPVLKTVDPDSGPQGGNAPPRTQQVQVTLQGTNFSNESQLVIDGNTDGLGDGVTLAAPLMFVSSEELVATLDIAPDARAGYHSLAVGEIDGVSTTIGFYVNSTGPLPPRLDAVEEMGGLDPLGNISQGEARVVRFVGQVFLNNDPTVSIGGSGVTVDTSVPVVVHQMLGEDYFEVPVVAATDATTGDHQVTITTAGGTSGSQVITIAATQLPPRITAASVSGTGEGCLPAGTDTLIFSADNFLLQRTTVTVSYVDVNGNPGEVEASGVFGVGSNSYQASVIIPVRADSFDITAATGGEAGAPFTVDCSVTPTPTPAEPILANVTPTYLTRGSRVSIKCAGTNFGPAPLVLAPELPTLEYYETVTANQDRVRVVDFYIPLDIGATGPVSILNDTVSPNQESAPITLLFTDPIPGRPFVSGPVPHDITAGGDSDIYIVGSNLLGTTDASWSGISGLHFSNTVVNSSDQVSVHVHADGNAALTGDEATNLTVTTPSGQSNPFSFIVFPP